MDSIILRILFLAFIFVLGTEFNVQNVNFNCEIVHRAFLYLGRNSSDFQGALLINQV